MSAQTPQVLSRRTNGALPAAAGQTHESAKAGAARSGRGRGPSDRHSEVRSTHDADPSKVHRTKAPNEGEKVVIRRLPPGMTEAEVVSILGLEWGVGKGNVDWFSFARGKVSHDPSKPSRPARAYFHLTRKDNIMPLSEVVRGAIWEDAKCTFTSPSLIGPPSLDFSIYKKVPGTKKRTDARQGTIDQDPEFMAFLEALANPAPLRESIDNEDGEDAVEAKVTTTPLIEYLKEKKANKVKEAASAKNAKHSRQESATTKGKSATREDDSSKKKGKESKSAKSDKAASKETVRILTKRAATEQAADAAKNVASQINTASAVANPTEAAPAPKSRRAGIAAAARILQRDLGLSPGSAHRRARQDAAKADSDPKGATNSKDLTIAANEVTSSPAPAAEATNSQNCQHTKAQPTTPTAPKAQPAGRRNRGGKSADKGKATDTAPAHISTATPPVILKKRGGAGGDTEAPKVATETIPAPQQSTNAKSASIVSNGPKGGASNKPSSSQKKPAAVSSNTTRGFIKHANPSQGITEAVLKQALEVFGTITFVEMDKRKGFAYVDFAEHAGLVKAVSASPISVAQGTVQVLERKDKKPAASAAATSGSGAATAVSSTNSAPPEKGSGRGRRGRGGGGGKGNTAVNGSHATAATNGAAPTANGGG